MGWDTPDVYNQPEKFDLTLVGEIQWGDASWDFDLTVVWVDQDGSYYLGDDSGCSCPPPFEYFTTLDKLEGPMPRWDAVGHLNNRLRDFMEDTCNSEKEKRTAAGEIGSLCSKILLISLGN